MLRLKFVDDARDALAMSVDGIARGAVTRQGIDGCRTIRFDEASAVLACERLAAARARGGVGLFRALLARLRPDVRYLLVDGGGNAIAQFRNVVRWGRGSHLELSLPDGSRWCVRGSGMLPRQLRLDRDGAAAGELHIEGPWRAQLRMPRLQLPPLVAFALGAVVLEVWGNDPHSAAGSD